MPSKKSPFEVVHAEVRAMPPCRESNYEARRRLLKLLRRHGWQKWEYEAAVEDRVAEGYMQKK